MRKKVSLSRKKWDHVMDLIHEVEDRYGSIQSHNKHRH